MHDLEKNYGSRPDLLPKSMVRLVRAEEGHPRRVVWSGRPGVRLLDLESHLTLVRRSLDRFPRRSDGSISWNDVDNGLVIEVLPDEADPESLLREFHRAGGEVVFFWGSLAIPSAVVEVRDAGVHLPAILDQMPEFWLYSVAGGIVLESAFSGGVTVARIPEPES